MRQPAIYRATLFAALLVLSQPVAAATAIIDTSVGQLQFRLLQQEAPLTTSRFIELAESGWYQQKTFYRVVKGHVAQAGLNNDDHPDMTTYRVKAEFSPQLKHVKGSLGMARGEDPDSGGTEFYISLAPRPHLDGHYTLFGQLIAGEAVLDQIASTPVKEIWLDNPGGKPYAFHAPVTPIVIQRIRIVADQPVTTQP